MNFESNLVVELLKKHISGDKGTKAYKDDVGKLIDYFTNSVSIDSNFSYESLSPEEWKDVIDFPNLVELLKATGNQSSDYPSFSDINFNYSKILKVENLETRVEKLIGDILKLISQIKIYKRAMDELPNLLPVDSITLSNKYLETHLTTFNNLFEVINHQDRLINYILAGVVPDANLQVAP
ncbi:MAG: hypothetical protein ACRYGG_20305 [Janthinobacterium lividum]